MEIICACGARRLAKVPALGVASGGLQSVDLLLRFKQICVFENFKNYFLRKNC